MWSFCTQFHQIIADNDDIVMFHLQQLFTKSVWLVNVAYLFMVCITAFDWTGPDVFQCLSVALVLLYSRAMFAKRSTPPGNDLVDHASRLGITLKSAGSMRMQLRRSAAARAPSAASNLSWQSYGQFPATPTYIHDVVVKVRPHMGIF